MNVDKCHNFERFKCNLCGKPFPLQSKLEEHITIVHTGGRAYKCDREMRGKSFSTGKSLWEHLRDHKWREDNIRFKCDLCNANYSHPKSLRNHKQKIHFEGVVKVK
jgi:transposase-like protein